MSKYDSASSMRAARPTCESAPADERTIAIDARIAFGRPIVLSKGISTLVIVERIDAGESVDDIAADYDLDATEIEQAVVYERAA